MRIGLALSGGGTRAAVFHMGVLLRLADEGLLESVSQLSTVSGGSLAIAAMLGANDNRWPTSTEFRARLYAAVRNVLTQHDLFTWKAVGFSGALRFNRRLLTDRAGVLADLLERQWGVNGKLPDLPEQPNWWINSTCLETGKNWRFSKREMGDWQFGRHYSPEFRIAQAAAASAAVPYVIGALRLDVPADGWYRTDPATRKPVQRIDTAKSVRLWDGGAYENLGLEPLYKPQLGLIDCDFLLCSDASGPLPPMEDVSPFAILRGHLSAPRLFDIAADQIRGLRSRMLIAAITSGQVAGSIVRMGNSVRDIDIKSKRNRAAAAYAHFQSDEEAATAFKYPTDLQALTVECYTRIARHGYEVTDATLTAHVASHFPREIAWADAVSENSAS